MSQLENKPQPERPGFGAMIRTMLEKIWASLTRNVLLKLLALFLAVLLWSVLIASDGTLTREKVFANAEVSVTGQDALRARGLIVLEDVTDILPTVRLRAEVMQSAYDRVTAANFGPRIDLSKIREPGEQTLQVGMTSTSFGSKVEVEPSSVTVTVEEYAISGRIPVMVEVVGTLRPGLWMDTPRADPSFVSVSGPKSIVQKVARVVVQLDQSKLTEERITQRGALQYMPQDVDGNKLDSAMLQVSSNDGVLLESILVDVYCYLIKRVPVENTALQEGNPAEGYEVASVTVVPESVEIAGPAAVLDEIERVRLDSTLKVGGHSQTFSETRRVVRPSGDIRYLSPEEVTVTAWIEEKTGERVLRNLPVEVVGLPEGLTAKLSRAKVSVTIGGAYNWLKTLAEQDVHLFVDAGDLPAGVYELAVQAQIDGAEKPDFVPEVPTLRVTLSETTN